MRACGLPDIQAACLAFQNDRLVGGSILFAHLARPHKEDLGSNEVIRRIHSLRIGEEQVGSSARDSGLRHIGRRWSIYGKRGNLDVINRKILREAVSAEHPLARRRDASYSITLGSLET